MLSDDLSPYFLIYLRTQNLNVEISLISRQHIPKMNNVFYLQSWDTFFMRSMIVLKVSQHKSTKSTFSFQWKGNNVSETWATLNRWLPLKASICAFISFLIILVSSPNIVYDFPPHNTNCTYSRKLRCKKYFSLLLLLEMFTIEWQCSA